MGFKPRLFCLLLAFLSTCRQGSCQSPGPDWPSCASTAPMRLGGWELRRFNLQPRMDKRQDALDTTLQLDFQNAVDGSRTVCMIRVNATNSATVRVLDSQTGGCRTGWGDKYEAFTNQTHMAPTAQVTYDMDKMALSINQTWTCREQGQLVSYVGTASSVLNVRCFEGPEGERTWCNPANLTAIFAPPTFVGPVNITRVSPSPNITPQTPNQNPISEPSCQNLQRKFQILAMTYTPPGPQPKSPSYWPSSLRIELRNLDDNSRTLCYLGEEDTTNYEEGILLTNNGEALAVPPEFRDRVQGCSSGGWFDKLPTEADPSTQEWRWGQPANVTFNTKTHVMTVSQRINCASRGTHSIATSNVTQELKFDCLTSGNEYYPYQCKPTESLYNNSSAPVILQNAA